MWNDCRLGKIINNVLEIIFTITYACTSMYYFTEYIVRLKSNERGFFEVNYISVVVSAVTRDQYYIPYIRV